MGDKYHAGAFPNFTDYHPVISRSFSVYCYIFSLLTLPLPQPELKEKRPVFHGGSRHRRGEARIYNGTCEKGDRFTVYNTAVSKLIKAIEIGLKKISIFYPFRLLWGQRNVELCLNRIFIRLRRSLQTILSSLSLCRKRRDVACNLEYFCVNVCFPGKCNICCGFFAAVNNLFLGSCRTRATQHSYKLSHGDRDPFKPTKRTHFIPSSASQKNVTRWILLPAIYIGGGVQHDYRLVILYQ